MTGFTARKVSNLRPNCTILACCPSSHVAEKVALNFGVKPIITEIFDDTDAMVEYSRNKAKEVFDLKEVANGKYINTTIEECNFDYSEMSKTTNFVKIIEI